MTCIIGWQHPLTGIAGIAADGRASGSTTIISDAWPKLLRIRAGVLGLSGPGDLMCRIRRAARQGDLGPEHPEDVGYWLMDLVRAAEWELKSDEDGNPPWWGGGGVLLARPTLLCGGPLIYDVSGTGATAAIEAGFPAYRGSGSAQAAGAILGVTRNGEDRETLHPRKLLYVAVETALVLDSGCGGRISVVCSDDAEAWT